MKKFTVCDMSRISYNKDMTKLTILAGLLIAGIATPALAQQVVTMPSLDAMVEQATNGGTIQQAEQTVQSRPPEAPIRGAVKDRKSSKRDNGAAPQGMSISNQREAEAAAAKTQKAMEKAQADQQSELIKQLKKIAKKQKAYKPLKKVKFLPPNSNNY